MRLTLTNLALVAAAATLDPAPARAAAEDAHAWGGLNASHDFDGRWLAAFDGQIRLTTDASRIGQYIIRPSIGYRLDGNATLSLGYAFVGTDPVGPAISHEQRLWQQFATRLAGDGKGLTVKSRSRLEQRWIEGAPDMGWRFRQQLHLSAPLAGKVRGFSWSEIFFSLDDTTWGQRRGLDRWRNSAGLSIPISRMIALEPAYINQWVSLDGPDQVHHIGNLTVSATF